MPSQLERTETTRAALCAAFRKSLLDKGLDATTTAAVLAETGFSKGAMYHHFASKAEIIEAVYRAESHAAVCRATESVRGELTAVESLKLACLAWLTELDAHDVARILLDIGPTALGVRRVREIEDELTIVLFQTALEQAVAAGEVELADTALAAKLVNGVLAEIAALTRAERKQAAAIVGPMIDTILAALSLRASPASPPAI
ncbi:TetR/AcrR family transcriptional regulator [Parerythrobacter aurantius]|uniref:TetR/AcrR family transcriptional regulator n=1 Tax=Parerythrobacter aurantius TaxID=3127706 RepID=UPI00324EA2D1